MDNQSTGIVEIIVTPKIGEYDLVLRIDKNTSWAEKNVILQWPEKPFIDILDDDIMNLEINNEEASSETNANVNSWELSPVIEYLLVILFIICIGLTMGTIVRLNKTKKPIIEWEQNLTALSTLEVEKDLIVQPTLILDSPLLDNKSHIEIQNTQSDASNISSIDEIFD
jgi:hypothetical protein